MLPECLARGHYTNLAPWKDPWPSGAADEVHRALDHHHGGRNKGSHPLSIVVPPLRVK